MDITINLDNMFLQYIHPPACFYTLTTNQCYYNSPALIIQAIIVSMNHVGLNSYYFNPLRLKLIN